MRSSSFFSQLCQIALHGLCIFTFVALSVPLAANEPFLNKPSNEWTEAEALQVLNDSPWAHTITTTTQETSVSWPVSRRNGTDNRFAFDAISCGVSQTRWSRICGATRVCTTAASRRGTINQLG